MQGSIPRFIKNYFLIMVLEVLVSILRFLVYQLCDNNAIVNIVGYVSIYAQFYVMSHVAVKAQEKILEENGEK